jgi:hypothetical protein
MGSREDPWFASRRLTALASSLFVTLKKSTTTSLRVLGEPVSRSQGDSMSATTSPGARYVHAGADDHASPAVEPDARQTDTAFGWPPSDADVNDIQVGDTSECREGRCEARIASSVLYVLPTESKALVTDAGKSDGLAAQTLVRAPVELVVQNANRLPAQAPSWNSRSWTAAAIAVCGLAFVTWFEVRSVGVPSSARIVSRHPGETMPLVPAERVGPHVITDVIGQQRVATSAGLQPGTSSPVTHVAPAAPTRSVTPAPVPLPPVAIADNAGARGNYTTDISRMGLSTAAIDSAFVAPTRHAHAAPAGLAERDAAETMRAAFLERRDDERSIHQVIQQYERAYEQLDVNAARAIWPSVDARALARAFDGLKEQKLEFSKCRVAVTTGEATVVCGGRASYVTRVGHHAARTELREWTFRLRKIDANWLIAKAEVQ